MASTVIVSYPLIKIWTSSSRRTPKWATLCLILLSALNRRDVDLVQLSECNREQVAKICHPLFKGTPIDYFDFQIFFDSGELINLTVAPYLTSEYYGSSLSPTFQEMNLFWELGCNHTFLSSAFLLPAGASAIEPKKYEHNIHLCAESGVHHRLYIVERAENAYYNYGFGTHKDNKSILNFYLNSMPLLQSFINYFNYSAADLITGGRIILPNYFDKRAEFELYVSELQMNREGFTQLKQQFDRCVMSGTSKLSSLSKREFECLSWFSKGLTMKAIAKHLQLSPRTVEQYLNNIKIKLELTTKLQIIEYWHQHTSK